MKGKSSLKETVRFLGMLLRYPFFATMLSPISFLGLAGNLMQVAGFYGLLN